MTTRELRDISFFFSQAVFRLINLWSHCLVLKAYNFLCNDGVHCLSHSTNLPRIDCTRLITHIICAHKWKENFVFFKDFLLPVCLKLEHIKGIFQSRTLCENSLSWFSAKKWYFWTHIRRLWCQRYHLPVSNLSSSLLSQNQQFNLET